MTSTISRLKIEQFQTPAMFAAVRAVVMATAYQQVIAERVRPVQQAAIDAAALKKDLSDGSPIVQMNDAYLSTDEAATEALYEDYGRRLIEGGCFGLTRDEILAGKCPELVAKMQTVNAENLLIDLLAPMLRISRVALVMTQRKQLIDLTLRMVVGLPGFDAKTLTL